MKKPLTLVCAFVAMTGLDGRSAGAASAKAAFPTVKAPEYSLAEGEPYPAEVDLAYRRFWNFLQHPNNRGRDSLRITPVIAVQVGEFQASEVPPALVRIARGRAQAMAHYGSDPEEPASARLKFVILFDSRDRRQVGPVGFFVNDTPNLGAIGNFGGIAAVYAGTR